MLVWSGFRVRNLSLLERRKLAAALREGRGVTEISQMLDRHPTSIRRELRQNGGAFAYDAESAHLAAYRRLTARIKRRRETFEKKREQKRRGGMLSRPLGPRAE